jgi:epoxide hydrolase-like predicted phosphatase
MPFRAVTFDLGGVLRPPPESVRNGKWEERFGLPEGGLFEVLYCNPVAQQALIGQATGKEMREEARCLLSLTLDEWEAFQTDRGKDVAWDTELLAFIHTLKSRYKTGVISNSVRGMRERVKEYVNNDTFDVIVFSDEEGVAKPDPGIYRRALLRLGVEAEETAFVDDHLPNVESAQALGIYAIHCIGSLNVQETLNRILSSQPASP